MEKLFNSEITVDEFLADYWQQKPLLLRNAFPGYQTPVTADELAGYACEDDSNARMVLESCGERPWSVEYGPFAEDRFASLPESGWSLLVSDMERHVPEIKQLQQQFDFIPDWRFDDVMISYAPNGASVGAHVDRYDVFLLQLQGQREWMISENFAAEYLADTDLEILASFNAEQQWVLEPGDMLYLPPGVAHHGIARGECMTGSIGFRTPASDQLTSEFMEHLCQHAKPEQYRDAGMKRQSHHAEISQQSLAKIREMISTIADYDDNTLLRWFGEYISEHRGNDIVENDVSITENPARLTHNPAMKFLFSAHEDTATLFVDGNSFDVSRQFAERVCQHDTIEREDIEQHMQTQDHAVLADLVNKNYLVAVDE